MAAQVPVVLVDGHNLLWRAAYGFPARIRSRDKTRDLTAGFGFVALLRVAIRDELPAAPEVIVVFDGEHGSAERQHADRTYKAHRVLDHTARTALAAIPEVQRGLDLSGIRWIEIDTAEADDVIATLVARCAQATPRRRVWIFSTDRDYYQLLTDRVGVLNTARHPGHRHLGSEHIDARYRVRPAQWPCFRALTGDPADNIPGIRGVGPRTAARLLAGGLTLDDLPGSGRLTGATGAAIRHHWDQVLAWRELIRMRTDLTAPHDLTAEPSPALPTPAEVIDKLELW